MIIQVAEHSLDISLLTNRMSFVLDLGCRGFEFADKLNAAQTDILHMTIYPIDIDDIAGGYYQLAISHENGMCAVQPTEDPQATHIKPGNEIPMMTIPTFSKMVGVKHWDLIKMDIEGSEYEILKKAQHPLATQISVEFHEHTSRGIGKEALDKLLDWLEQWYVIHNRVWEERHGCSANYWDVLLIAK